jgi:hypothetical protein
VLSEPERAPVDEAGCWSCGAARGQHAWCPRCLERYERPEPEPQPVFEYVRARRAPHTYSRVRGGPTSFGPVGRVVMSIVPVVVAFIAIRNIMRSRGDGTVAFYIVLGVPTVVMVAGFLVLVWRKERMF